MNTLTMVLSIGVFYSVELDKLQNIYIPIETLYHHLQTLIIQENVAEVIWTSENRVMGQRSWGIFHYVIVLWENGLEGVLLPTNMDAAIYMFGDFLNFEQP